MPELELSELGENVPFKRQMSESVFFHEKTQKLLKYARAKDKQVDLEKELEDLSVEERTKLCKSEDERHNTALHYAAKAGNLETCKFLVGEGADISALGQNKMRPLQFAARYGDGAKEGDESRAKNVWKCMKWIMEEEDKLKSDGNGQKEKEIFVDGRDNFSILHHAIQNTNWEEDPVVVQELIMSRKFKITKSDKQGNTCLHLAAQFDRQDDHTLLEAFLPSKASDDKDKASDDMEKSSEDKEKASDDKEKDYHSQNYIPQEDLEKCVAQRNNVGMTPLHLACAVGNPDSVKQLLAFAQDADSISVSEIINDPDSNGSLPISLAITSKNLEMVEVLLKNGATVNEDTIFTAARSVQFAYTISINAHFKRSNS